MLTPGTIATIAFGLLATGGLLALAGLFPPLWIIPLAVGGTFTATSFQAGRVCYPRHPVLWALCAAFPLAATIVAFVVIEQARQLAVGMVVRRHDSQLRTDIVTMLRDRPEDYPPGQAEILRQERLARVGEILADPYRSESTNTAAEKARVYLAEELPRERGFRFRVNQTRLTRQMTEALEAARGMPLPAVGPLPPGGLVAALEDRAGLGARFLRHMLVDMWAERDMSRRAACDLEEVRHLVVFRWGEPRVRAAAPRRAYPCEIVLVELAPGAMPAVKTSERVESFATDDDAEDGGAETLFPGGEAARAAAIRQKLKDLMPRAAEK